jgi:hypothetical protein
MTTHKCRRSVYCEKDADYYCKEHNMFVCSDHAEFCRIYDHTVVKKEERYESISESKRYYSS